MTTRDSSDCNPNNMGALTTEEFEDRLASASYAKGDPTGWFEALYSAGEEGRVAMPWSRNAAHPLLVAWAARRGIQGGEEPAIVVGCGLGADAEYVSSLGYATTAFDISPTAIRLANRRHPASAVEYVTADLLDPPRKWRRAFHLVIDVITVQALPDPPRRDAIVNVGRLVAPGGTLVVIAAAAHPDAGEPEKPPPWPLQRGEIESFASDGLDIVEIEMATMPGEPTERRWQAEFHRDNPTGDR
jgi:SAM-dependent methyltransferase